jgi:hypothetical protein
MMHWNLIHRVEFEHLTQQVKWKTRAMVTHMTQAGVALLQKLIAASKSNASAHRLLLTALVVGKTIV